MPGGGTFLDSVINGMASTDPEKIVVVVGPWWTGDHTYGKADVVVNNDPDRGQISSVRSGLAAAGLEYSGMMMALVDHPTVGRQTYAMLARAHEEHPDRIVIPVFSGKRQSDRVEGDSSSPCVRRGHPVVFPKWSFSELAGPGADAGGARVVVKDNASMVMEMPVDDPGVVTDLDTREQYRALMKKR